LGDDPNSHQHCPKTLIFPISVWVMLPYVYKILKLLKQPVYWWHTGKSS
jgi:hypothetical protein